MFTTTKRMQTDCSRNYFVPVGSSFGGRVLVEFRHCYTKIGTFSRTVESVVVIPSKEIYPQFDKDSIAIGCVNGRIKSRLWAVTNGRHGKSFPCVCCSLKKECDKEKIVCKSETLPIVLFEEIKVQ
jgi:hypothetical protein